MACWRQLDTNAATAGIAQLFFFGNVVLFVVFTLLGSRYPQMPSSRRTNGISSNRLPPPRAKRGFSTPRLCGVFFHQSDALLLARCGTAFGRSDVGRRTAFVLPQFSERVAAPVRRRTPVIRPLAIREAAAKPAAANAEGFESGSSWLDPLPLSVSRRRAGMVIGLPAFGICDDSSFFVSVPLRGCSRRCPARCRRCASASPDAAALAASAEAVSGRSRPPAVR